MASRREQRELARQERLARERAATEARRRKRLVAYVAGGLLALAAVAAGAFALNGRGGDAGPLGDPSGYPGGTAPPPRETQLGPAVQASGCRLESFESEGAEHVQGGVDYKSNPPHSGDHSEVAAEDQAFREAPRTEELVHSLEHGRIVIHYKPGLADEVRGGLKALYDEDPYHVILTPNATGMPYEVAATAWRKVLGCPRMNDRVYDAIRAFRDRYRDRGPEDVP